MTEIEVENLSKIFGKNTRQALEMLHSGASKDEVLEKTGCTIGVNNVSFSVEQGEVFVIMGLSGSGKSTLVRLLNRLIEPTEGVILIDGQNLARMDKKSLRNIRRKKMSMVFQNFALFPYRTVLENVEYGLEIQGMSKENRKNIATDSLKLVGLGPYMQQKPNQLSGGMQQRVGLARALANDPGILLMDEAFSALDPMIRKDMQDELMILQSKMQKTIIFITHDLNEALRIGDRIALMRDGAIVQIGKPEEILIRPKNEYVERFVEDIDRSKVLTARHIMKRAEYVEMERHGPRVALQRMREEGHSGIYVVDGARQLIGFVNADDAADAIENNIEDLKEIVDDKVPQVQKDASLHDIFDLIHNTRIPVAVVEDGKLSGVIVRGAVIAALSNDREVNLTHVE